MQSDQNTAVGILLMISREKRSEGRNLPNWQSKITFLTLVYLTVQFAEDHSSSGANVLLTTDVLYSTIFVCDLTSQGERDLNHHQSKANISSLY